MLIKASKRTLPFFKQHFCENPSKLANLADFVIKKKDVIFSNISGGENIEEKKKCPIFDTLTLNPWTFFSFFTLFLYYLWGVE